MTSHQRWGLHEAHDHSAHAFEKNLGVAFDLPGQSRIPARARALIELSESGPKRFVHSRFKGDVTLNAVLNGSVFLRRRSRGLPVQKVQQALIDLEHPLPQFGADADFGSETQTAVKSFQREVWKTNPGFSIDGVVGPQTMEQLDLAISRLRVRKSVTAMSPVERVNFTNALNEWNRLGKRRQFVRDHNLAQGRAHGNSGFLPWHRQFMLNFETELRAIDDTVSLPYWDWVADRGVISGTPNWSREMSAMIGGDGTGAPVSFGGNTVGRELLTGPIEHWRFINGRGAVQSSVRLARAFNDIPTQLVAAGERSTTGLPVQSELDTIMAIPVYDAPDFGQDPPNLSFRAGLEKVLHNYVHLWVGGHMGRSSISPNDPAFFLHHCMVDKIWADWQRANPHAPYLPTVRTGRAPGPDEPVAVRAIRTSSEVTVTPAQTLNMRTLTDSFGNNLLRVRYV